MPEGFLFAVKASRTITHYKRLRNAGESLDLLLKRARLPGDRLGPILYQLPPRMTRDDGVLGEFVAALPEDLRHAIEFRHTSWFVPEVFRLLERNEVALCTIDLGGFECPLVATADFVYHRFHGYDGKYSGCSIIATSSSITITLAMGETPNSINNGGELAPPIAEEKRSLQYRDKA